MSLWSRSFDTGIVCGSGASAFDIYYGDTIDQVASRTYNLDGNLTNRFIEERYTSAGFVNPVTGASLPVTAHDVISDVLAVPGDGSSATETTTGQFTVTLPGHGRVAPERRPSRATRRGRVHRVPGGPTPVPRPDQRRPDSHPEALHRPRRLATGQPTTPRHERRSVTSTNHRKEPDMHKLFKIGILAIGLAALGAPAAQATAPTNGQIVFGREDTQDGGHIFTANPDGTHEHQLLADPADCPNWSPDGTKISVCVIPDAQGLLRSATLNPDGSGFNLLDTPDPSLNIFCWAWSPDGSRLACEGGTDPFSDRDGIYTIRSSDGGGLVRLTNSPSVGRRVPGSAARAATRPTAARSPSPASTSTARRRSSSSTPTAPARIRSHRGASGASAETGRETASGSCSASATSPILKAKT